MDTVQFNHVMLLIREEFFCTNEADPITKITLTSGQHSFDVTPGETWLYSFVDTGFQELQIRTIFSSGFAFENKIRISVKTIRDPILTIPDSILFPSSTLRKVSRTLVPQEYSTMNENSEIRARMRQDPLPIPKTDSISIPPRWRMPSTK